MRHQNRNRLWDRAIVRALPAGKAMVFAMIATVAPAQEPVVIDAAPAPQVDRARPPAPASLNQSGAFVEAVNVIELKRVTEARVEAADAEARALFPDAITPPPRNGIVRELGDAAFSTANGSALRTAGPNGEDVWTMAVRSPGASGLRIHFAEFDVGRGTALVYAENQNGLVVRGPYKAKGPNGRGDFWTSSLPGETAYIEVTGVENPVVTVGEIVHFDRHPAGINAQDVADIAGLLSCHVDANCFSSDNFGRDATGQMNFNVGTGSFVCSGTLMNDFDGDTFVPHFLTAFHCLSTQASVNTLEVVWRWESASCGGALPDYFSLPRNDGGTLIATNSTNSGNDMTFIRLDGPVQTAQAGLTTGGLPSTFTGYHHPSGSWKRGTTMFENSIVTCSGRPTSDYHYVEQSSGVTEGGSSGSAIFDGSDRVMGQLFGVCCPSSHSTGCGTGNSCCLSGCSNRDEYNNVYGKMSVTWPLIERWLRIGGTINVDGSYGGTELGTPAQPFNTVSEGNNFAWDGSRIKIQAGSYSETLTFTKRLDVLAEGGSVLIGD